MRPSIINIILLTCLGLSAGGFLAGYVQARAALGAFGNAERARLSAERLVQLERTADVWIERQVARIRDIGVAPLLIQGVMQPETQLRETRRYLDHVMWDGVPVQLSLLDFEGRLLYRRHDSSVASLSDPDVIQGVLDGDEHDFVRAHTSGGAVWVSVGAPVGRPGYPEGVVIATLPMSSLSNVLSVTLSDGLELRFGTRTLFRSGRVAVSESIALAETGLSVHFAPDLSALDTAIGSVERSLALQMTGVALVVLVLLNFAMRRVFVGPIGRLVDQIEGLDPDGSATERVASQEYRELDSVATAFNRLLERLGASHLRLVEANRTLEDRVARRTAQLEASNQDLERFASVASHDLQEPLRKISSFVGLLQEEHSMHLDSEGRRFLEIVSDGAQRMRALIRDLLEFSRVGRNSAPLGPVELSRIVERVVDDVHDRVETAGISLKLDPLPTVLGTDRYLTQLFQNLITNAIKFLGDGDPVIHVGAEIGEDECVVFVRDHGIGIDPRHVEKVFGMFERLHSREEYPGTGIGLAICKRVVEELGGRMWFDETPGGGTTFYCSLKLISDTEKESE